MLHRNGRNKLLLIGFCLEAPSGGTVKTVVYEHSVSP